MKRKNINWEATLFSCVKAFCLSVCIYLVFIFILTLVMQLFYNSADISPLLKYFVIILSSISGAYFFAKGTGREMLICGLIQGLCFALLLLGFSVGQTGVSAFAIIKKLAFVTLTSVIGSVLAKIKKGFNFK